MQTKLLSGKKRYNRAADARFYDAVHLQDVQNKSVLVSSAI